MSFTDWWRMVIVPRCVFFEMYAAIIWGYVRSCRSVGVQNGFEVVGRG
jgi:hypothetical protein